MLRGPGCLILVLSIVRAASAQALPAFPGAEGFGADTPGGRGGRVIEVTNLNDAGPGSFRAAAEASGPRIVVFRIGGTIELDSRIDIEHPYITIAGQTAPGGGITLKNGPNNPKAALRIATHDVVMRFIRSRPGSHLADGGTLDALTIATSSAEVFNVIVDHGSFSWATDEVVNVWYDAHDITIQWSIISEALDCATHPEGCHGMGMLLGSEGSRDMSIHHNLFAHNRQRNPRIKTVGTVDVVNNLVYNPGFGDGWRAPSLIDNNFWAIVPANYVNNYLRPGPSSSAPKWYIDVNDAVAEIFARGNDVPDRLINPEFEDMLVASRHAAPPITTLDAADTHFAVLEHAGASLALACGGTPILRRDAVDARIVNEVLTNTGSIIDDPSEVGGWPELEAGTPCDDSDHDGMPDAFEILHRFDPQDPSDGPLDADGDGYTNVEEFLNSVQVVPEPGTLLLQLSAVAVVALRARCRQRRA
ncbi:MAG: pectate lyase [Deltaproteobacteria bacterium]|nr:MAG: pectate lyase [Deltaproteobacteria bacterium]